MNLQFHFDPDTFKMHAEGVGAEAAQKIEEAWHSVKVTILGEDGAATRTITASKDGQFAVQDGEPDPMSKASEPVAEDHGDAFEDKTDDADGEHEPTGFQIMSRHADEMQEGDAD